MVASTIHLDFLAGGGEIESLIQSIDWSQTPLGPISSWQQSLKISVRIVLGSRYPMFLWWGEELTLIYNEAYAKMTLAGKHPWAMGRPGQEVWAEIWDDLKPRIDTVIRLGQGTWDEELLLLLERKGFPEETYHTFSYSPIPNDDGGIGGVICPVVEETKQVLSQRRLRTLRDLAEGTTEEVKTVAGTCHTAIQVLTENPKDLPFALIYLLDDDQKRAWLAESSGLPDDSAARQAFIDLTSFDAHAWPLAMMLESKRVELVTDLAAKFGDLPRTVWPDPPHTGLILPIKQSGQVELAGFLVVGLSPRLALDDDYRGFLELTAGHIGTAIANARAYEAERQRAEGLAELDRAKTTFFNNISHEFRTPLTLMLGPIEESLAEADNSAERQRLELLHRNALRLQKLVNTLLDFSRMEAGRLQAFFEPTDLAVLTRDLASVFRSAVEKAGMQLLIDCAPLAEAIYVDRDKWEQIVLNLISNAFKFTLVGEIEVSLRDMGDAVELAVRDTGSGIRADQLPHIFERFHRVEGTRARTLEGTGIGLAFVSELARLHGGTVGVESVLGAGSTFTVTVPKGKAHLPPEQVGSERTATPTLFQANRYVEEAMRWLPEFDDEAVTALPYLDGDGDFTPMAALGARSGMRIVLADDNADMRDYVRRLLAEKYEVVAVGDGVAALEALHQNAPDLLLTDVMMPQLDGFGLLQAIRADEKLKMLPVIMLSARAGEEAKVEGLDAGADDYLVKPFGARELLARVGAQLELARVRREAMSALRASETRYRALATATSNSIYRSSADGSQLVEVMGGELLQRPAHQAPSMRWLEDYVHPDDQERVLNAWLTAMATQTLYEIENRAQLQDGSWGWIHSRAVPVRDEAGNVVEWIGSATDITARKRAEEELRESEERYRLLFDAMNEGFFVGEVICDDAGEPVDYYIREANRAMERILGYKREEMIGQRALSLFPSLNQELMRVAGRVALTGEPADVEGYSPVLQWWYRSNVYSPRPRQFALVFVDMTERRRIEVEMQRLNESLEQRVEERTAQVRESEERFRALIDASAQIVWTMDSHGRVVEDSLSWREFTGQSFEQGRGWGWMDAVHPNDRERTFQTWRRSVTDSVPMDTEFRVRHRNGEWYWMQVRAVPLFDEAGGVRGWVGMNIDIHERKQAEADRERLARSLMMAEQEERRRISQVLHDDLQQLLYAAQMRLAMIVQDLEAAGQMNLLKEIEEARSWLRQCIETTRQMTVDLSPPILKNEGLSDALEWLQPQMERRHGLKMVINAVDNFPITDEDLRTLLFQIVRELLFNVAKHAGVDQVKVDLGDENGHLVIRVVDDGQGFDPKEVAERKRQKGGFGLFSVHERLRLVGGRMEIDSQPGRGTRVVIYAPVQAE